MSAFNKPFKNSNYNTLMSLLYMAIITTHSCGFLRHACLLRFDVKSVQKACCGVGGEYDFSLTRMCGAPNVPVCGNPHERISWDGVHLTQKAYKIMASWLIRHIFPKLQCFHHWF
ncbi:hypothetical protein Pint_19757 [Pistacia integerrima]|uniref:Uncharacterized protein n=1 Tax=Pistacia integerrima TaxID=434235 RepID=A0ACC0XDX9_9ROSI|nr:hypothetical protein Pint_19757 [Pistacia integerrima]